MAEEYPNQLGIALTDCITMDAFLRDFGPSLLSVIRGYATIPATRLNGARKPLPITKTRH
jgi:hypothetical protein